MALFILKAKPNPAGKDKTPQGYASVQQLGGEWVDIKNIGDLPVNLGEIEFQHKAFSTIGTFTWKKVTGFTGTLPVGQIVRVHSGSGPESKLLWADKQDVDYHVFTNRDQYVWNNAFGDSPRLIKGHSCLDEASYGSNPPEGTILSRIGDWLVVSETAGR